jgi:hypothetical protein
LLDTLVGDEKHLYVVPATNLRCLHLRAKFSHGGAGLGGVVRTKQEKTGKRMEMKDRHSRKRWTGTAGRDGQAQQAGDNENFG